MDIIKKVLVKNIKNSQMILKTIMLYNRNLINMWQIKINGKKNQVRNIWIMVIMIIKILDMININSKIIGVVVEWLQVNLIQDKDLQHN